MGEPFKPSLTTVLRPARPCNPHSWAYLRYVDPPEVNFRPLKSILGETDLCIEKELYVHSYSRYRHLLESPELVFHGFHKWAWLRTSECERRRQYLCNERVQFTCNVPTRFWGVELTRRNTPEEYKIYGGVNVSIVGLYSKLTIYRQRQDHLMELGDTQEPYFLYMYMCLNCTDVYPVQSAFLPGIQVCMNCAATLLHIYMDLIHKNFYSDVADIICSYLAPEFAQWGWIAEFFDSKCLLMSKARNMCNHNRQSCKGKLKDLFKAPPPKVRNRKRKRVDIRTTILRRVYATPDQMHSRRNDAQRKCYSAFIDVQRRIYGGAKVYRL